MFRKQTRRAAADTKRNISGASEDVKEGVDQVADTVADATVQAQEGLDEAGGTACPLCIALSHTASMRLRPGCNHQCSHCTTVQV